MSKRRDAKTMARWEDQARQWATATARDLAVDLYYNRETAARPYSVGVVLDPGEKVWAEVPIRFNFDLTATVSGCHDVLPAFRPWLVTSDRVVGRLASDRLQGYRWENVCGIRVDLAPGHEVIEFGYRWRTHADMGWPGCGSDGGRCRLSTLRSKGRYRTPGPNLAACLGGRLDLFSELNDRSKRGRFAKLVIRITARER